MDKNRSTQTFTQPKSFKIVADHNEKALYALIVIGFFYTYHDLRGRFLYDVLIIIGIIFVLLFIVKQFLLKVIWRFDVDFNEEKITFFLCRNASPVRLNFKEIDKIKVSGPIVFIFKNKKLYYSTNQYTEVLETLCRVKKITWGKMCNLLGPDESIRKIIEKG